MASGNRERSSNPIIVAESALFSFTLEACRARLDSRDGDLVAEVEMIRNRYLRDAKYAAPGSDWQDVYAEWAATLTHLLDSFRNQSFHFPRVPATPETKVRGRWKETSVERLVRSNRLEKRHGAAALEIGRIYQAIVSALEARARIMDGTRVDGGGLWDLAKMPDWVADKHLHLYRPWCAQVVGWRRGGHVLAMLQAVICLGEPLDQARRRWRFDYDVAFCLLRDGLDLFADMDEQYQPPEPDEDSPASE